MLLGATNSDCAEDMCLVAMHLFLVANLVTETMPILCFVSHMFCALLNIEESSQFRSRPTGRLSLNSRVLKKCFKRINSSIEFLHLRNFLCPFLQKNDVCFASELVGLRLLTELVQQSNFMAISTCTVGFGKQTSSFGMYPSGHVSCASTSVPTMA